MSDINLNIDPKFKHSVAVSKKENTVHVEAPKTNYSIVLIDHENDRENQKNHLSGKKYDYESICSVLYMTNDYNDSVVKLNEYINKAVEGNTEKKFDKLMVTNNIVQIYDRTLGWVTKENKLIFTYLIVSK